ncbi:MAG: hypothetical protein ACK5UE_06255 [Chitinophagales bacterium]|jgi:hypothetical protein|nr:hypothetical protein [Sphingobacteriales bacterium]
MKKIILFLSLSAIIICNSCSKSNTTTTSSSSNPNKLKLGKWKYDYETSSTGTALTKSACDYFRIVKYNNDGTITKTLDTTVCTTIERCEIGTYNFSSDNNYLNVQENYPCMSGITDKDTFKIITLNDSQFVSQKVKQGILSEIYYYKKY